MGNGAWKEETLDPEDWDAMRKLGHRMLDDMIDAHQNLGSRKIAFPTEEAIKEIQTPLSEDGEGTQEVYEVFLRSILPHAVISAIPRFWAYVAGTGSTYGMLADMLASGTNLSTETLLGGKIVHNQVIEWIGELLDFPPETGGVLTHGGSEANFTGLAVARNAKANDDVKARGVQCREDRMTLYGSEEMHHCLERSVELLGLGNEALRWIPTDDEYRIDMDALRESIATDRSQGHHPFCVIGNAGTVNTGAFDDLNAVADLCEKENLWFHVDGAYGSWVKLSETHRHLADGLERADSLAVDLHKWMYMPYAIGCTLVRDREAHFSTFVYGHQAEYLTSLLRLDENVINNPNMLALPLSRQFTSLKAYMLLRAYGKRKYCNLIQQNLDQMEYLASLIREEPKLVISAPIISNVVCFQYKVDGLEGAESDKLNEELRRRLWETHPFIISDTTLKGSYMLRACSVNHRSRKQDFEFLVNEVIRIGDEIINEDA